MISKISPVLARFVSSSGHTNPMKKNLKFKFNAKLQESRNNLFNFTRDNIGNIKF